MQENVDGAEQKKKKRLIRSERVQSGESDTAGEMVIQGGLSLSPVSPDLSPPLSPREADTSLHPFDRSQKGG